MDVVEASGLGKRYGRTWALRECTLQIPAGRVTAQDSPCTTRARPRRR